MIKPIKTNFVCPDCGKAKIVIAKKGKIMFTDWKLYFCSNCGYRKISK